MADHDPNNSGTLSERLWAQQDANWNVTALVNNSGVVVERCVYDPYGAATVLSAGWSVLSGSNYAVNYLWQGLRRDSVTGLLNARNRDVSPTLGRPLQADPLGLAPDTNYYRWEGDQSADRSDPRGTDFWSGLNSFVEGVAQGITITALAVVVVGVAATAGTVAAATAAVAVTVVAVVYVSIIIVEAVTDSDLATGVRLTTDEKLNTLGQLVGGLGTGGILQTNPAGRGCGIPRPVDAAPVDAAPVEAPQPPGENPARIEGPNVPDAASEPVPDARPEPAPDAANEQQSDVVEKVSKRVIATVIDPETASQGGPNGEGKYIAYHGTTEAGAKNINQNGIDSRVLGNPDEFQLAINPNDAANYGAGAAEDAGGGAVKLVKFEIPEELFLRLYLEGHIKAGSTTGSIDLDEVAQKAINEAMGK